MRHIAIFAATLAALLALAWAYRNRGNACGSGTHVIALARLRQRRDQIEGAP